MSLEDTKLAIIGLGYVGLPLAVEFGKRFATVGFDVNSARIAELEAGRDHTLEVSPEELRASTKLRFTDHVEALGPCNVFIVTVPTPVDAAKRPDLTPLDPRQRDRGREHPARATSWCTSRPSIRAPPRKSACRSSSACRD